MSQRKLCRNRPQPTRRAAIFSPLAVFLACCLAASCSRDSGKSGEAKGSARTSHTQSSTKKLPAAFIGTHWAKVGSDTYIEVKIDDRNVPKVYFTRLVRVGSSRVKTDSRGLYHDEKPVRGVGFRPQSNNSVLQFEHESGGKGNWAKAQLILNSRDLVVMKSDDYRFDEVTLQKGSAPVQKPTKKTTVRDLARDYYAGKEKLQRSMRAAEVEQARRVRQRQEAARFKRPIIQFPTRVEKIYVHKMTAGKVYRGTRPYVNNASGSEVEIPCNEGTKVQVTFQLIGDDKRRKAELTLRNGINKVYFR